MGSVYRGHKEGWVWGPRPGKVGGAPGRGQADMVPSGKSRVPLLVSFNLARALRDDSMGKGA